MSTRRELITDLRAHRAGLIEKQEAIEAEIRGIEAALVALGVNGPAREQARRAADKSAATQQRKVKYKAPDGKRREQILDYLRAHPDQEFGPAELARLAALPRGSVSNLWQKLIDDGDVEQVGNGYKNVPIIKHKPTTIKPGYEVVTP